MFRLLRLAQAGQPNDLRKLFKMSLVKLCKDTEVAENEICFKDSHGQLLMYTRHNGELSCWVVPAGSRPALEEKRTLPESKYALQLYGDDGYKWIVLPKDDGPKKIADTMPGEGVSIFSTDFPMGQLPPAPTPLVPFAGCDRKAMPPSPAKPFAPQPSPVKPSPLKERIDVATTAVARKNWGQRQAKMGEFFGQSKANVARVEQPKPEFVPSPNAIDI